MKKSVINRTREALIKPFDKLRVNGNCLFPFVASLSNHERKHVNQNFSNIKLRIALFAVLLACANPAPGYAGPGHGHGDEGTVTAPANAPRRQADGSIILPKRSQRQLGVRTTIAEVKTLPKAYQWVGTVAMDPNAGGKVQPTIAGRIEPGSGGLPALGQSVKKGDILASVQPSLGALERANQAAQAAELRAELGIAQKRLARLRELEGSVPRKEIDASQAEVMSLKERLAAIGGSLVRKEALRAPISGVIASSNVVAGQVVGAREVLFEIVDPERLLIEAITYDVSLANTVADASASVDGGTTSFPLKWVGSSRALREQALPVWFRTVGDNVPPLSVGQKLQVVVQTHEQIEGVAVPAAAIVKNPSNQDIVWVHTSAERFVPHPVRYQSLDGNTVTVIDGLEPGDRAVVQGAQLINQIR